MVELWMLLSCFDDQCVAAVVVVVAVDAVVMVVVVDFADVVVIVVVFDERCPVSMGQNQRWMTTTVATVVDDFEAIASCHCRWIFGVWRNDPVSDSFLFVRICCCSAVVVSVELVVEHNRKLSNDLVFRVCHSLLWFDVLNDLVCSFFLMMAAL